MNRELIQRAIKESGLEQIKSCCNVELKFCSTDEWRGDLAAFANILLRIHDEGYEPLSSTGIIKALD